VFASNACSYIYLCVFYSVYYIHAYTRPHLLSRLVFQFQFIYGHVHFTLYIFVVRFSGEQFLLYVLFVVDCYNLYYLYRVAYYCDRTAALGRHMVSYLLHLRYNLRRFTPIRHYINNVIMIINKNSIPRSVF
jgi:hypothetical protein